MRVENLIEHPQALDQLAHWHYAEWHYLYPEQSLQDFADDLERSLRGAPVPATWVLVDEEGIWGSASVIEQDMSTNQHLGPWLASVYVHPDKRGRGLGRQLISTIAQQCRQSGLTDLYLFTPGQEKFYLGLGWKQIQRETYQGEAVTIMHLGLQA
ncbi:GNAT family N-acetyltransferase [Microbulbifer hainanensis]|uniref:GNAT family N-acetyltransferase n=1 Tax=Microbulbifer hainanensis TaxID=2735675 RepID=UPI001867607D|nr:GNAT family N-acetyltransferase [Microbulbifer hainanensis]